MATPENQPLTGLEAMMLAAAAGTTGPREERSTAAETATETTTAAEGTGTIEVKRRGVKDQREINTTELMTWRLGTAQRRVMTDVIIGKGIMPWKGTGTEAGMLGWMRGVASAPARMMSPMAGMRRGVRSTSTRSTSTVTKQAISQSTSTGKETREESFASLCDVWIYLLSLFLLSVS